MKLGNSLRRSSNDINNYLYHKKVRVKNMVTGHNVILLHPKLAIEVKRYGEVKSGSKVIVSWSGSNSDHSFGNKHEDIAIVSNIAKEQDGKDYAYVSYSSGHAMWIELTKLLLYEDYLKHLEAAGKPLNPTPMYSPDRTVYVKPSPAIKPSSHYPSVGSNYETDVKILSVECSKFGSCIIYTCYIPGGAGYQTFSEESLIPIHDKQKYVYKDFKKATVACDLLPFFKGGEEVKIFDGFVYNKDETTIVQLTKELEKLLS